MPRKSAPPPKHGPRRKGLRVGGLRGLLRQVTGTRMCFGEPVIAEGRTVIPVARVKTAGGWGWGGGDDAKGAGDGGGGGGYVEASPVGFIELDDTGSRYHEIPDPDQLGRSLKAAAGAAATLVTAVGGVRALRRAAARPRLRARGRLPLLPR